jgi:hypothetical protein
MARYKGETGWSIKVAANGSPSIQFLDQCGRVVSQLRAPP